MIYEPNILARAREAEIRRRVRIRQQLQRTSRPHRNLVARLTRRALCRLGATLVVVGQRLECYEFRAVGEADYVPG